MSQKQKDICLILELAGCVLGAVGIGLLVAGWTQIAIGGGQHCLALAFCVIIATTIYLNTISRYRKHKKGQHHAKNHVN